MTGSIRVALINSEQCVYVDEDAPEMVFSTRWRIDRDGYARCTYKAGHPQLLHRVILPASRGMFVDHIDRNRLNNTRGNLRIVTASESARNQGSRGGTSRFRGVCRVSKTGKWQVVLGSKYIGTFKDEITAAHAWIEVASIAYGEVNVQADRAFLAAASIAQGRAGTSL